METARCRAFLAAADTGSFSKAAELLSYTPSGVSQLVSALEADIGYPCCGAQQGRDRHCRGQHAYPCDT